MPIRHRDEDGRLEAAGLQWTEKRELAFVTLVMIGMFALMGAAGAVFWPGGGAGATRFAWTMLGVLVAAWLTARLSKGQPRALIFHRDGRTSAPHGFAHYKSKFREVTGTNANIVSIEARGDPADADVVMYSREGDVAYLAGHLHRDNAHKVAVQLTLALAELRESLGKDLRDPQQAARQSHAARVEAVID